MIRGTEKYGNSLKLSEDASFIFSTIDDQLAKTFLFGALNKKNIFNNINISSVTPIKENYKKDYYYAVSPILLKYKEDKRNHYFTYEDDPTLTSNMMKQVILKKASKFGVDIDQSDFSINFDHNYKDKKIKWIDVHGIKNKSSLCPIEIKGPAEIKEFICNVGVGNSTGSGFGTII